MSASDYEHSDAAPDTSLQPNDAATCGPLATVPGVQSLPFNGLQDAPAIARRLTEVLGRMPCSCDKCDHKLPRSLIEERAHALDAARALYEPTPVQPEPWPIVAPLDEAVLDQLDQPIALRLTDSAWKRVDLVKRWRSLESQLTVDELERHVVAGENETMGRK